MPGEMLRGVNARRGRASSLTCCPGLRLGPPAAKLGHLLPGMQLEQVPAIFGVPVDASLRPLPPLAHNLLPPAPVSASRISLSVSYKNSCWVRAPQGQPGWSHPEIFNYTCNYTLCPNNVTVTGPGGSDTDVSFWGHMSPPHYSRKPSNACRARVAGLVLGMLGFFPVLSAFVLSLHVRTQIQGPGSH